jgi:hypothetical protein
VEDEVDEGLEEEDAMAFGRCREGMKGEGEGGRFGLPFVWVLTNRSLKSVVYIAA